jgi:hypothetical protein
MASSSYACKDYPEMEWCPGTFEAATEQELWSHMELHASAAHGENPADWGVEDRAFLQTLIKQT